MQLLTPAVTLWGQDRAEVLDHGLGRNRAKSSRRRGKRVKKMQRRESVEVAAVAASTRDISQKVLEA